MTGHGVAPTPADLYKQCHETVDVEIVIEAHVFLIAMNMHCQVSRTSLHVILAVTPLLDRCQDLPAELDNRRRKDHYASSDC